MGRCSCPLWNHCVETLLIRFESNDEWPSVAEIGSGHSDIFYCLLVGSSESSLSLSSAAVALQSSFCKLCYYLPCALKGKKKKKRKLKVAPPGYLNLHPNFLQRKKRVLVPLLKFIAFKYFLYHSCCLNLVEVYLS